MKTTVFEPRERKTRGSYGVYTCLQDLNLERKNRLYIICCMQHASLQSNQSVHVPKDRTDNRRAHALTWDKEDRETPCCRKCYDFLQIVAHNTISRMNRLFGPNTHNTLPEYAMQDPAFRGNTQNQVTHDSAFRLYVAFLKTVQRLPL